MYNFQNKHTKTPPIRRRKCDTIAKRTGRHERFQRSQIVHYRTT